MNQKQHRRSLKWLQQFFNASTDTPQTPSQTITLSRFLCKCMYKQEASFTKRKGSETAVEVIGGQDKYLAACRACYFKSPSKRAGEELPLQQTTLNPKMASPAFKNVKSPMKQRHLSGGMRFWGIPDRSLWPLCRLDGGQMFYLCSYRHLDGWMDGHIFLSQLCLIWKWLYFRFDKRYLVWL